MVDQELVLRILAFRFMDYEKSKKNIATFLDEMVHKLEKSSPDELEMQGFLWQGSISSAD